MSRPYKSQSGWIITMTILVLGFAPIVVFEFLGLERAISTFPDVLGPGVIAWMPRAGISLFIAGVIPFLLASVVSKLRGLLVNPVPALIACFVLAPLPVLGAILLDRGGGEAIFEDRLVVREAGPWGRLHEEHLTNAILIEKGCDHSSRGGIPTGIYNIVFASGRRASFGTSGASNYGLKRREYLAMVQRVDLLPSLSRVERRVREVPWGGAINAPGCLKHLADEYPPEDRATVFGVYAP